VRCLQRLVHFPEQGCSLSLSGGDCDPELEEDASCQEVRKGPETASAAADLGDLVGRCLVDRHDMLEHYSWRENVGLVARQLETGDEELEQMELEMRGHPGMVRESYDHSVSKGEEPVRMELESCDHCLASSEDRDRAFEGYCWDLGREDLDLDALVVAPKEERRLENRLDLGEA
jgi:hypothetical protein